MTDATASEVLPRYRERQQLGAGDLEAQQSYLVAMRRRHLVGGHSWGIVTGLAPAAGVNAAVVQPGVAIDGYGRELVVQAPITVPANAFADLGASTLELWLVYALTVAPDGCRWHERALLRVERADGDVDGRRPPGVPAADLHAGPVRRAPDAGSPWPVYLGSLKQTARGIAVDLARRLYAGAVGEHVAHPEGGDAVRLGGDEGGFGVDAGGTERLAVEDDGNLRVRANTAVTRAADLTAGSIRFNEPAPIPAEAAPWHAYRVRAADRSRAELRFEIAPPPADTEAARVAFAVGTRSGSRFIRCLTVNPDCSVRIGGDLSVGGRIVEGPVELDPDDPRFAAALLARWLGGITSAGLLLNAFHGAAVAIDSVTLARPNEDELAFSIVVRNSGSVPLRAVRTAVDVTTGGTAVLTDEQIGLAAQLAPGDIDAIDDDRSVPLSTLDVVITATGVGLAGNTVTATEQRTVPAVVIPE